MSISCTFQLISEFSLDYTILKKKTMTHTIKLQRLIDLNTSSFCLKNLSITLLHMHKRGMGGNVTVEL